MLRPPDGKLTDHGDAVEVLFFWNQKRWANM